MTTIGRARAGLLDRRPVRRDSGRVSAAAAQRAAVCGLPAWAISARPGDPTDAGADGGSGACSSIARRRRIPPDLRPLPPRPPASRPRPATAF